MNDFADLYAALGDQLAETDAESDAAKKSKAEAGSQKRQAKKGNNARAHAKLQAEKLSHIAVLDMETDPFDSQGQERIAPFAGCITSDHFDPIKIWDEDPEAFVAKIIAAIESLPGKFTIYAHNGGKFDYLFLVHKLRGAVSFKGRGIMMANIGRHELRDSFHILPEKLSAFQKDAFDYSKMHKSKRRKHKKEIMEYLLNDCLYLLDAVKRFIEANGLKLSIGQASLAAVKDAGIEVENINERMDDYLRQFYFGGRVECIQGLGAFKGHYKLFDVNSMYPAVMADRLHPTGAEYIIRRGGPGPNTVFLDLNCENYGAFVARDADGGTTASIPSGRFKTTIWEYDVARRYSLISGVKINFCVDCVQRQDFSAFVVPKYARRQTLKAHLKELKQGTAEYVETKFADMMEKFFLNNAYGKYAQNPRKFKETFLTDKGFRPNQPAQFDAEWLEASKEEWGPLPVFSSSEQGYAIWEKPTEKRRFKNVGTSASITGAARAVLLEAICNAVDPIYCDTDSLICRELLNTKLDPVELGAWDLEDEFCEIRVAGKKMYACKRTPEREAKVGKPYKTAAKGVKPPTWDEYGEIIEGAVLESVSFGPTLTKRGGQSYVTRAIRATAKPPNRKLLDTLQNRIAS